MNAVDHTEQTFPRPLSGAKVETPPPGLVPPRTPMVGTEVTLEPQNAGTHAEELYTASHDSEDALRIWDYLAYGPWSSADSYAETLRQQSSSMDPIFYSVRSHASGRVCGQASFLDIHPQNGVIEIGHIWFGPDLQGTRGATEALFMMLCRAMDDLGYRRMQWRCNALNANSRSAALRLGFRFEGVFYNHLIFKGKNRDTAWYSVLDDEWPEVRQIIGSWLDDGNFDTDGRAKASLSELMKNRSPSRRTA